MSLPINLALRMGRPDLVQGNLAVSGDFSVPNGELPSGISVSGDVTTGRIAISIIIVLIGAIAISYVATRTRQF